MRNTLGFALIAGALAAIAACATGPARSDDPILVASADSRFVPARNNAGWWQAPVSVGQDQIVAP